MRMRTAGRWPRLSRAARSRPSSRGVFRVTAAAVVLVAAGVTAGSAPAVSQASEHPVTLRLGYSCAFRSGAIPVSAQVTATYPVAGTVGQPIQPTGTRIAVILPHAAVADLASLHATTATLTAGLDTAATEGTKSSTAMWRDFTSPGREIPQSGPTTFTASGAPPTVTPAAAGEVAVIASDMLLVFTAPRGASSPATSSRRSSSHATRADVQAVCALRRGQDATLARIEVARPASAKAPAATGSNPAKCLPFPNNLKLNPLFPLPKPLPGSRVTRQPGHGCSYAAGFTNAKKLNEAVLVGPGLADLNIGYKTYVKFPPAVPYSYFYQQVPAQLQYHGRAELPPARATLLAFGFMPVSATLQISEIGSLNAALISCSPAKKTAKCPPQAPNEALFFGRVMLRIYDVDINGVPLDVGPHCQTAIPFNLELTGHPPSYDISLINGILTGTVTVPQFTGCANGSDNLDPVFDATVSGPGNFVKINQAPFCTPLNNFGCPPVIPKPKH